MTVKVTLRKKKIGKGKMSLYLDFYPAILNEKTGELSRRHFLGLYILQKPKTSEEKEENKKILAIAESNRSDKHTHLNKPEIYNDFEKQILKEKEQGKKDFISYFKTQANKRTGSTRGNWNSTIDHFKFFTKGNLKFEDLNYTLIDDFKAYLQTAKSFNKKKKKLSNKTKKKLSNNTAAIYFSKFRSVLIKAYKDGFLQTDLTKQIECISLTDSRREFLTMEEVKLLINTPCKCDVLRRAAFFSILTGLRRCDIRKMKWCEIEYTKGRGYKYNYDQQKTDGVEYLPISEQAYELLGERKDPKSKVFAGLKSQRLLDDYLALWISDAGLTKHITFHCFRHTYATLQLNGGTDLYTVSKMLGHKDIKTTQIYAKILDETKRAAANTIVLDL